MSNVTGCTLPLLSLSARRAWIEIVAWCQTPARWWVALRKESVDRNINKAQNALKQRHVALRKESVDRNVLHGVDDGKAAGRSPQGERG